MTFTGKSLSRRTALKGLGATVALPMLDAMTPAPTLFAQGKAAARTRLVCIEQVHGGGDYTKQFVRYRNIRVKELKK